MSKGKAAIKAAALLAEPILGVGGFITPPPEYFQIAVGIVRKYGGLFICDEVQTVMPSPSGTASTARPSIGIAECLGLLKVRSITVSAPSKAASTSPSSRLVSTTAFGSPSWIRAASSAIARRVFSPAPEDVRHARRVIAAMGDGTGALMLDGKMEDDASVKQCRVMVELADQLAAKDPELAKAYVFDDDGEA